MAVNPNPSFPHPNVLSYSLNKYMDTTYFCPAWSAWANFLKKGVKENLGLPTWAKEIRAEREPSLKWITVVLTAHRILELATKRRP